MKNTDNILYSTSNTIKSKNIITFSLYKGNLESNLFQEDDGERPEISKCSANSIDFSCPENSQYISSI